MVWLDMLLLVCIMNNDEFVIADLFSTRKIWQNVYVRFAPEHDISKVNLNSIRFFVGANVIKLKRETKRVKLLELISAARIEFDRAADRLLPKNASTKPSFIASDKTLFRLIRCYFDPSIRESMQKVGNSLPKEEVDSRRKERDAYESLLDIYDDEVK